MWLLNILLLILILGVLILVHEIGHFIFARKSGVHIYEFALGMGPVIYSKKGKKYGTLYNIRLFPIGGFVNMAGEVSEDDTTIPKEKFMCNKTGLQKLLILIGGVTFNVLLAWILLFASALIWGSSNLAPVIGDVAPDFPIAEAGIVPGDRIIEINGRKVRTWDKAQLVLNLNHEGPFEFIIKHPDNSTSEYEITPKLTTMEDGSEREVFGFSIDGTKERGLFTSLRFATLKLGSVISSMYLVITNLFTGGISLNALAGPVGIYSVVGASAAAGAESIIYIVAFLSINLAFINFLPFPAFDGGRILFLGIEKIKGSPVNAKVENAFHTVGFILLMLLMVYITFQDILRLFLT